jgi:homoserine kinase
MNKTITVKVPATSANLGPGFDVLGVALRLYNEVTLSVDGKGMSAHPQSPRVEVTVEGEGAASLPRDGTNLVARAALKVFDRAKKWPKELQIKLVNRIPLSRGLGSSAAASLGGICAANILVGKVLPSQILLDMATQMEGHPDNVVPAFVGGLCVTGIIDGHTRYLNFPGSSNLMAVVCSPDRPLGTTEARRVLPSRIPFSAAVFTSSRVAFFLAAFLKREYQWLSFAMEDVLHQPARARLIPGLPEAIRESLKAGAYGAALSGAGSSVLAFAKPGAVSHRVGEAMEKAFRSRGVASRFQILGIENKGVGRE